MSVTDFEDISPEILKKRSLRGGTVTAAAQIIRFFLRMAAQIVLARLLLPSDYGLVAMVAPFLGLLQLVADMGLTQAVVQARVLSYGQLNTLFWLGLAINTMLGALMIAMSPVLAHLYGEPRLLRVALIFVLLFPIAGLAAMPLALLNRTMRFDKLAIIEASSPIIYLIAGIVTAARGLGYQSLIIATVSESLYAGVCYFVSVQWKPSWPSYDATATALLRSGGHLTIFNFTQYFTTTADNIAVAYANGAIALGLYDKSYKLVTQPIGQLLSPANRVAIPLLSRLFHHDLPGYVAAYSSIIRVLMALSTPFLLFGMSFSSPIITALLGQRWSSISPIVVWLCLGGLASTLYSSTTWLFMSQNRSKPQATFGASTSIISMIGFMAGLPWGPVGVAAGAGISFFFVATPIALAGATMKGPVTSGIIISAAGPILLSSIVTALCDLSVRSTIESGLSVALFLPLHIGVFYLILSTSSEYRKAWQKLNSLRRGVRQRREKL